MRIGLTISFFLLSFLLFCKELTIQIKDSLPQTSSVKTIINDSLLRIKEKAPAKNKANSLKVKNKRLKPSIKPMEEITISDYKILYLDDTEKSVDTSLSLEGEYSFNFLRKDYFEFLPLPNMGEGFNRLGYDFHEQSFTPQMGARVKHFGYFEKEDVPYYEMPSSYT